MKLSERLESWAADETVKASMRGIYRIWANDARELEAALEASREAVAKLAGIRVNMQSSIDQLSDQLTDSEAEVARLTAEIAELRGGK